MTGTIFSPSAGSTFACFINDIFRPQSLRQVSPWGWVLCLSENTQQRKKVMSVFKVAICSVIALMGAAGAVGAKGGASAVSPGSQIKTTPPADRGDLKGASTFSPGSKIQTTPPADRGDAKGASTFSPGQNK
jgi:hypothetical protein